MENSKINIGLLILRVYLGGLLLFHGLSKLINGVDWMKGMIAGYGLPSFIAYGSLVGEVVAPLLIMIGFRTRIASLVMAFNMLMAILLVHLSALFTLNQGGGWAIELPAMFLFGAVVLYFTGSGKYAVSVKSKWD